LALVGDPPPRASRCAEEDVIEIRREAQRAVACRVLSGFLAEFGEQIETGRPAAGARAKHIRGLVRLAQAGRAS